VVAVLIVLPPGLLQAADRLFMIALAVVAEATLSAER
jgi:hypothetical protein